VSTNPHRYEDGSYGPPDTATQPEVFYPPHYGVGAPLPTPAPESMEALLTAMQYGLDRRQTPPPFDAYLQMQGLFGGGS
jgi:hypothetical protein